MEFDISAAAAKDAMNMKQNCNTVFFIRMVFYGRVDKVTRYSSTCQLENQIFLFTNLLIYVQSSATTLLIYICGSRSERSTLKP